jgi:hypothetical protein
LAFKSDFVFDLAVSHFAELDGASVLVVDKSIAFEKCDCRLHSNFTAVALTS